MAEFGETSLKRLSTCHPDLQKIAFELIKEMNVTICCGHRNEEDQNKAYTNGFSRAKWPDSPHNKTPSEAMDIAPYNEQTRDLDWSKDKVEEMQDRITVIARLLDIPIKLGRDFKSFPDDPHVELA